MMGTFANFYSLGFSSVVQTKKDYRSSRGWFFISLSSSFVIPSNPVTVFDCIWANVFIKYRRWIPACPVFRYVPRLHPLYPGILFCYKLFLFFWYLCVTLPFSVFCSDTLLHVTAAPWRIFWGDEDETTRLFKTPHRDKETRAKFATEVSGPKSVNYLHAFPIPQGKWRWTPSTNTVCSKWETFCFSTQHRANWELTPTHVWEEILDFRELRMILLDRAIRSNNK